MGMTLVVGSKRLLSLDAMRGLATLSMIPMHVLMFGGILGGLIGGDGGGSSSSGFFMVANPPLGTGLIFFFFVTGMSLTISLNRRRESQSINGMISHVVFRYGGYMLIGIVMEIVMWLLLGQKSLTSGQTTSFMEMFIGIFLGTTFSGPIIGLGFSAIVASFLIPKLSWKKLAGISIVLASAVSAILYYVIVPMASSPDWALYIWMPPLSFTISGIFSLLKGLPMVLIGALIGKLVLERRDMKKIFFLIGGAISVPYIVIPTILGSRMFHLVYGMWSFPHAFLFMIGSSLFLFGIFHVLENRNTNLSPLTVIGRSSFLVYYGHMVIYFILVTLVGHQTLALEFGLMAIAVAVTWIIIYFYSKRRWGSPSSW